MIIKRLFIILTTLLILSSPTPAFAWWDTGHMIVAQIAYDNLTPQAKAEAKRLINHMAKAEPPVDHFVPAAVWMDDLHRKGMRTFAQWHYINLPYNPDGLASVPPAKEQNVIWAIEEAYKVLKHPEARDFQKSLMLRILIHTIGDIHQPMHNVGRSTLKLPHGDRGGNDFKLKGKYNNLHKLWDSGAHLFKDHNRKQWATYIPNYAREITNKYPQRILQEAPSMNPKEWSKESFTLAVGVCYQNIQPHSEPSAQYIQQAQPIIQRRLAMGGYRLANLLNSIFK